MIIDRGSHCETGKVKSRSSREIQNSSIKTSGQQWSVIFLLVTLFLTIFPTVFAVGEISGQTPIGDMLTASYFDYMNDGSTVKGLSLEISNLHNTLINTEVIQLNLPTQIPVLPTTICVVLHQDAVPVPHNVVVVGNKVQVHIQGVIFAGSSVRISCTAIMGSQANLENISLQNMLVERGGLGMIFIFASQLAQQITGGGIGPIRLPGVSMDVTLGSDYLGATSPMTLTVNGLSNLVLNSNTKFEIVMPSVWTYKSLQVQINGTSIESSLGTGLASNNLFLKIPSQFIQTPLSGQLIIRMSQIQAPAYAKDYSQLPTLLIHNGGVGTGGVIIIDASSGPTSRINSTNFGDISVSMNSGTTVNAMSFQTLSLVITPVNIAMRNIDAFYLHTPEPWLLNFNTTTDMTCTFVISNVVTTWKVVVWPDGYDVLFTYLSGNIPAPTAGTTTQSRLVCQNVQMSRYSHDHITSGIVFQALRNTTTISGMPPLTTSAGLRTDEFGFGLEVMAETPVIPYSTVVATDPMTGSQITFGSVGMTELQQVSQMKMSISTMNSNFRAGDKLRIIMGPNFWQFIDAPTSSNIHASSDQLASREIMEDGSQRPIELMEAQVLESTPGTSCTFNYPTSNSASDDMSTWNSLSLSSNIPSSNQILLTFPSDLALSGTAAAVVCDNVRNPSVLVSQNANLKASEASFDVLDVNNNPIMAKQPMESKASSPITIVTNFATKYSTYQTDGSIVMVFQTPIQLKKTDTFIITFPPRFYSDYTSPAVVCFQNDVKISTGDQYYKFTNTANNVNFVRILDADVAANTVLTIRCTNVRLPTPIPNANEFTTLTIYEGAMSGGVIKAQTLTFVLNNLMTVLGKLGNNGSYVQAPNAAMVTGSTYGFSFIIKPVGIGLNPNTVLKLEVPFGYRFYSNNDAQTCNVYSDLSSSTSYGQISNSIFFATDYDSLYIPITGYLPGDNMIRVQCQSIQLTAALNTNEFPMRVSIYSRNPRVSGTPPSFTAEVLATITAKAAVATIGRTSVDWGFTGHKQASSNIGLMIAINGTNAFLDGDDTIRIVLEDQFAVLSSCSVLMSPGTNSYNTQPLPVTQDVYHVTPTANSGSTSKDPQTFIDLVIHSDVAPVFGVTSALSTLMMDPNAMLTVICSNMKAPPHATTSIPASIQIIGIATNAERGLAFSDATATQNLSEAVRASRSFSSVLTLEAAPFASAKVTHTSLITNTVGTLRVTIPPVQVPIPVGGNLQVWLPNDWHPSDGDEDAGWTPEDDSSRSFVCEVNTFLDSIVTVNTQWNDGQMWKVITVEFKSQVVAGSNISIACAQVRTPNSPTVKVNSLTVLTQDDQGRSLETTNDGTIPAVAAPLVPQVSAIHRLQWVRAITFNEDQKATYAFGYQTSLTSINPTISIHAANFTTPLAPSTASVSFSDDDIPFSQNTFSTQANSGTGVIVYNVYTNVTAPAEGRTSASLLAEVEAQKSVIVETMKHSLGLTLFKISDYENTDFPLCSNGIFNPENDETDVDCGGEKCPKCSIDSKCEVNSDCRSGFCDAGYCAVVEANEAGMLQATLTAVCAATTTLVGYWVWNRQLVSSTT